MRRGGVVTECDALGGAGIGATDASIEPEAAPDLAGASAAALVDAASAGSSVMRTIVVLEIVHAPGQHGHALRRRLLLRATTNRDHASLHGRRRASQPGGASG